MNFDINALLALASNPLVQLGGAALGTAVLLLLAVLIKANPKAADVAQDLADLAEELEPWVNQADALHVPGAERAAIVRNKAEAWLKEQGITGLRGRVVKKHLPALLEVTVKRIRKAA